ncbi:MAG: VOC family protein [Porphyrobacter sp.]|nr:VOC family protein [Porphyrobacter sp.]
MSNSASIFLMFNSEAEAAANFYAATFPDSAIGTVIRPQSDVPGTQAGKVQLVEMRLCGMPCVLLNAGQDTAPNQTFSLQVYTDDQAETDRLWDAIIGSGGAPIMCGWCKDKWGFHWQITPRTLMKALSHPDPAAAARAQAAMLAMTKIDIAAIEAAVAGDPS